MRLGYTNRGHRCVQSGLINGVSRRYNGWPRRVFATVKLPLPRFTRSPIFFVGLAALHLNLGGGHIYLLFHSAITWTDICKALGAAAAAYYFVALALRAHEPAPSSP